MDGRNPFRTTLKPWTQLFVGIFRGISIPGFLNGGVGFPPSTVWLVLKMVTLCWLVFSWEANKKPWISLENVCFISFPLTSGFSTFCRYCRMATRWAPAWGVDGSKGSLLEARKGTQPELLSPEKPTPAASSGHAGFPSPDSNDVLLVGPTNRAPE